MSPSPRFPSLLFSVCILSCVFWMLTRLCSLRERSSCGKEEEHSGGWGWGVVESLPPPPKFFRVSVCPHPLTCVCLMSWCSSPSSSAMRESAETSAITERVGGVHTKWRRLLQGELRDAATAHAPRRRSPAFPQRACALSISPRLPRRNAHAPPLSRPPAASSLRMRRHAALLPFFPIGPLASFLPSYWPPPPHPSL